VLLAFAYAVLFHAAPSPATVEGWWWQDTRRLLPAHARDYLMTIAGMSTDWPLPLWTLKVELLASLVLPLLAWVLVRSPLAVVVAAVALSAAVVLLPWQLGVMVDYFPSFMIGSLIAPLALLALHRSWPDRTWQAIAALGLGILLFSRLAFVADFRFHYAARPPMITEALGGMLIIAAVTIRQHAFAWLCRPGLVWLGDISYSLYLLHMPILGLVAGIAAEWLHIPLFQNGGIAAAFALTACVIALTLPAAALSYRYIELPGIRLGKTIGKRILRSATASRANAIPGAGR
jgi:peptidoglycan/LPS O-acetylase OafA/YrhL